MRWGLPEAFPDNTLLKSARPLPDRLRKADLG